MPKNKIIIEICMGSSCHSKGSFKIVRTLEKYIEKSNNAEIKLTGCLCQGNCSKGPFVRIQNKEYTEVSSTSIISILKNEYKF